MWWGLTPAVDVLSETPEEKDFVNVLLIAQSDSRHVLQTVAKKYKHPACKTLKFYIYEPLIENVARSLLFTTLALDDSLGLGLKSTHFMELYGNTLLRQPTWKYLSDTSSRLSKAVTNFNFAEHILPSVSFDNLKYKERDHLENILKFWSKPEEFNILEFWDQSVRSLLGTRYDSRLGVFDWDHHMRYRPYGADSLTTKEYKLFREKGIAFLLDDSDPSIPNVTLASFPSGSTSPADGYFGDVETGPFPAFGFDCEDQDMMKKVNGQIRKSATELTERNTQRMFYEIQHQKEYEPPKEHSIDVIRQDCSEQLTIRKPTWKQVVLGDKYSSIALPGVDILYLPTTALKDFPSKPQFQNLFDAVTIPEHLAMKLPPSWIGMCKNNCKIVVEASKYVLSYRKDDLLTAKHDLDDFLKNLKCDAIGNYDMKTDDFIRYMVNK